MSNKVKENDVVKRISPTGTDLLARVRWVNEKGEAGVTYLAPDSWAGSAQVVEVDELEVVKEGIGEELKYSTKAELIAAIGRLRKMRLPKKTATRRASTRKPSVKSKLDMLFAEGGDAFADIIKRTVKEMKEEEEGGS